MKTTPSGNNDTNPQPLTRRRFIQRTAAASAASVFALATTATTHADIVSGQTGYLVDIASGNVSVVGDTAAIAIANLAASIASLAPTITPTIIYYNDYTSHLEELTPPRMLNAEPAANAKLERLGDGSWRASIQGPVSYQVQTHKLVQNS